MMLPELAGIGMIIVLIRVFTGNFRAIIQSRLNQGLGIVTLWLMISASLSPTPGDAWIGLGNFLPFFFFFSNIRQLIKKPSQLRQLAWVMVIPSVWVVVMGWGQIFLGWQKPEALKGIFTWPYGVGGEPDGRMSSVFMYRYNQISSLRTPETCSMAYQHSPRNKKHSWRAHYHLKN